jgi:hypothetical protein
LEFKPQFNKVYTQLTDQEIEENEKAVFDAFRDFIKTTLEINNLS